jgi:hypothetical protein
VFEHSLATEGGTIHSQYFSITVLDSTDIPCFDDNYYLYQEKSPLLYCVNVRSLVCPCSVNQNHAHCHDTTGRVFAVTLKALITKEFESMILVPARLIFPKTRGFTPKR